MISRADVLRHLGSLLGPEFRQVVSEERGLVASARDGNVAEAGVERILADTDIGVNENAFGGEPLGATKSTFAKGWEQFVDHEWIKN